MSDVKALRKYSFAESRLLASYTFEYYWKGRYYPGTLSQRPREPEEMWKLYTTDGISFTLHRASSRLKMQKEESQGLGQVKMIVSRLGGQECIREVAILLRDFRAAIDTMADHISFDAAIIVGHYMEITPIEKVVSLPVYTHCGN